MSPQEVSSYLDSFINHELTLDRTSVTEFKLDRLKHLLDLLGHPEKNLKIIHVAGSKGKGSVCAMTANILKSAGYHVGLFTSPHIWDFRERIRILSSEKEPVDQDLFPDMISTEELAAALQQLKPFIEEIHAERKWGQLTYFEIATVLAIYHFYQQKVDFVVLETGLGGRLDSTNVFSSIVCAITPISLEHTRLLGETYAQIAAEKAAIIKDSRQRVVISSQIEEARLVIEARCREIGVKSCSAGENASINFLKHEGQYQLFDLKTDLHEFKSLRLALLGAHQLDNAAVSVAIVEQLIGLGHKVSSFVIEEGLKSVFWPGRFEVIQQKPLIIMDGAHNAASIHVLLLTVKEIFPKSKIILVLAVARDKDILGMAKEFQKHSLKKVILTQFHHPRSYRWREEDQNMFLGSDVCFSQNLESAITLARKNVSEGLILITGSLFTVSEARKLCSK
jgi:dihydrofolate synthase/folylpolyglutamate synthase